MHPSSPDASPALPAFVLALALLGVLAAVGGQVLVQMRMAPGTLLPAGAEAAVASPEAEAEVTGPEVAAEAPKPKATRSRAKPKAAVEVDAPVAAAPAPVAETFPADPAIAEAAKFPARTSSIAL